VCLGDRTASAATSRPPRWSGGCWGGIRGGDTRTAASPGPALLTATCAADKGRRLSNSATPEERRLPRSAKFATARRRLAVALFAPFVRCALRQSRSYLAAPFVSCAVWQRIMVFWSHPPTTATTAAPAAAFPRWPSPTHALSLAPRQIAADSCQAEPPHSPPA